ncbi:hypothetical protein [Mycobacterium intracellulare]|uniref:hypothetical protein n=1 Tax=Mycobacterium intracellulare TaxID=1767 RepID=UPI00128E9DF3|nr:hypothetical protein [Mycobacterium intracellulare]MDM3909609.1 hypothetical protein [Mycobacterium intracellulare subsp. chimaera]
MRAIPAYQATHLPTFQALPNKISGSALHRGFALILGVRDAAVIDEQNEWFIAAYWHFAIISLHGIVRICRPPARTCAFFSLSLLPLFFAFLAFTIPTGHRAVKCKARA